ncbi:hypothetical protein HK102_010467 [Quaeritorhiza haematococci]|nr:hypothetical protein HK102_010467 [Quaeritorhiza haematococci]
MGAPKTSGDSWVYDPGAGGPGGKGKGRNGEYIDITIDQSTLSSRRNAGRAGDVSDDTDDGVTSKYRTMYEGSLDPFQRFHRQEEARRLNALNPAERATLSLTRMIVMNKYSRLIFVAYSGLLHCLVIVTLYQLSQWEECRHDHEWLQLIQTPNVNISALTPAAQQAAAAAAAAAGMGLGT